MARTTWGLGLGVCLVALGCAGTPAKKEPGPPLPFHWPPPPGWRTETIPFPLDFAPDLPFQGLEELRFPPGFFDPASEHFWSYAFVWWLEGTPDLSEAALERALSRYFVGLAQAVGKDKYTFDPAEIAADLQPVPPDPLALTQRSRLTGHVRVFDAFKTGKYLTLQLELQVGVCGPQGRRVVWVSASPKSRPDPVWTELDAVTQRFECPTSS
jgi:hypothetical protein